MAGGLAAPAIAAGFGAAVGMAGGAAGVAGAGAAGASFAGALGSTVGIVGIGGGIGVAGGNYVGAKTARRIADISVRARALNPARARHAHCVHRPGFGNSKSTTRKHCMQVLCS